jgi:hypothetical protein
MKKGRGHAGRWRRHGRGRAELLLCPAVRGDGAELCPAVRGDGAELPVCCAPWTAGEEEDPVAVARGRTSRGREGASAWSRELHGWEKRAPWEVELLLLSMEKGRAQGRGAKLHACRRCAREAREKGSLLQPLSRRRSREDARPATEGRRVRYRQLELSHGKGASSPWLEMELPWGRRGWRGGDG